MSSRRTTYQQAIIPFTLVDCIIRYKLQKYIS